MRIVTLDITKKVTSIKDVGDSYILQSNDIVTELGEMGQIQQLDGSFITPVVVPVIPVIQPTNKEINDNLMTVMSGLVDIYMALPVV